MKILLITGWGLGTAVLSDFAEQLRIHHEVEVWDIFDPTADAVLNEKVEASRHFDVLMGWSLGGQLALLLADEIAKRTKSAKPVIACMSNPCFVAHSSWSTAMSADVFNQFARSAAQDMPTTIKRFSSLVALGSSAPRHRAKHLQRQVVNTNLDCQEKHLYLLKELDLLGVMTSYQGKMLFVFAEQDALVPGDITAETALTSRPNVSIEKIEGAHDAILFDAPRVIEPVLQFLVSIDSPAHSALND